MIYIDVSDSINSLEKKLDSLGDKSTDVVKKAINLTAKSARKDLEREAKNRYVIKTGGFNRSMKIKSATKGNLVATISSQGKALEIKDFRVSPASYTTGSSRPIVTKGKVLKSSKMKNLEKDNVKAFVAKFKSGHVAVVERVPGKRMKSNPQKEFLRKLLSPSIPSMLGNEETMYNVINPNVETNLYDNINKVITKIMGV